MKNEIIGENGGESGGINGGGWRISGAARKSQSWHSHHAAAARHQRMAKIGGESGVSAA